MKANELREEGRREVVEWIESLENESGAENVYETRGLTSSIYISAFFKPKIFRDKWQAKLKDWGVKQAGGK